MLQKIKCNVICERSNEEHRDKGMAVRVITLGLLIGLSLAVSADTLTGKVVKITDGDTLYVLDANYKDHKIRLAGIDAPERRQAYGLASRKHLLSIEAGKQVTVEYQKRDRYGRIVGKVLLASAKNPTKTIATQKICFPLNRCLEREPLRADNNKSLPHLRLNQIPGNFNPKN